MGEVSHLCHLLGVLLYGPYYNCRQNSFLGQVQCTKKRVSAAQAPYKKELFDDVGTDRKKMIGDAGGILQALKMNVCLLYYRGSAINSRMT